MRPNLHLKQSVRVFYQIEIVEKGRVVYTHPRKSNLILNVGLDSVATRGWTGNIAAISVGNATVPVKRDSGATTFARVGNTVTANNAFFDPTDDDNGGRLLKFDTGEEMTVTAYISALTVTVSVSGTLASSQGTLWYVNEHLNTGEFMRFNNVDTSGSSFAVDTYTHTVQYTSPASSVNDVAREIGWSWSPILGQDLFGRDLVSGGGVSIVIGQQFRVTLTMTVKYSPASAASYGDVGNNGFNTAGQGCYGPIRGAIGRFPSTADGGLDPDNPGSLGLYNATFTLTGMSETDAGNILNAALGSLVAYTSGNYYRDTNHGFGVGSGNFPIYGFCVGNYATFSGQPLASQAYNYLFTSPQTKDNLHNLVFTRRTSWQRVLVN